MRISHAPRLISAVLVLAVALLLTWALNTRFGMVPALGPLLDPWQGFWQNMERDGKPDLQLSSEKLRSTVVVRYDERGVPHIFADNDYDLYFAQGLVTARDRLWQIDFQTRAAAGRLAELIGPAAVDYDRSQRRLGMLYGAEVNARAMASDPRTALITQAYADGYNAWLQGLSPADYPVEYKILGARPEPFTPLGSALLLMNMSQTLSAGTRAVELSNARALLDEQVYRLLFPDELPWTDPVIQPDHPWEFEPLAPSTPTDDFEPSIVRGLPVQRPNAAIGSNSWAVDSRKSATGYPVLASDPHLGLNLPSIWYEVQLHSTGAGNAALYADVAGGADRVAHDATKHAGADNAALYADVAGSADRVAHDATKHAGADKAAHYSDEGSGGWNHAPLSQSAGLDNQRGTSLPIALDQPFSTYGVSLPGAPGVIIGFNSDVAWGITNTGSNALDLLEIEFRDHRRQEYLHDGQWKPVQRRIETIAVRGAPAVTDTVLYTHHGPVTQTATTPAPVAPGRFPPGHAIQWMAHEPGHNILLAIYAFNRARDQQAFEAGLRHFTNLPQNVTYADRHGNISMGHMGSFPVRFFGQGSYIGNGRDPAWDWTHFVPFEHLPRSFNPDRGFVSSANQAPATRAYPYYLGRSYYSFSRGARVNRLLKQADDITGLFFEHMLMDNHSLHAEKLLPFLLSVWDGTGSGVDGATSTHAAGEQGTEEGRLAPPRATGEQPSAEAAATPSEIRTLLADWDYRFDAHSPVALFYAAWEQRLLQALWKPLIDAAEGYLARPNPTVTMQLLLEGPHEVFPVDIPLTIIQTFDQTLREHIERFGDDPRAWHYATDRSARIGHLAMLPGFGREQLLVSGRPETINATGTSFGPSWRMVVELGPTVRARGHYPGAQTGNPGHPDYDRFVDDWATGTFYDLHFWQSADHDEHLTTSTLTLHPQ